MDPLFDHEKLDVYWVELGFIAWIATFLDDASLSSGQHRRELIEQLDRASLSVLLNTAEGNGKRQGRQRAKFFDDARGSAFECAACLDAAVAKGLVSTDRVCPGKQMLARVVAMLTRLIDRFDT
jgi:four helix bundle protein